MKKLALLIIGFACYTLAFATAQMSELITYNGKCYGMFSLPLEEHTRIDSIRAHIPDKWTTALYRCYRGYWSIKNDSLFLDSIGVPTHGGLRKYDISKDLGSAKPVFASWFTGSLHLIGGKCVFYIHDDWLSKYEDNIYLDIVGGKVKESRIKKNELINPTRGILVVKKVIDDFVNENFHWLETGKRIVVQAQYVEADPSTHKPIRTKIRITRDNFGMTDQQQQEFIDKLSKLMIDERLLPAAWVDGKIYCDLWTFPITKR